MVMGDEENKEIKKKKNKIKLSLTKSQCELKFFETHNGW